MPDFLTDPTRLSLHASTLWWICMQVWTSVRCPAHAVITSNQGHLGPTYLYPQSFSCVVFDGISFARSSAAFFREGAKSCNLQKRHKLNVMYYRVSSRMCICETPIPVYVHACMHAWLGDTSHTRHPCV